MSEHISLDTILDRLAERGLTDEPTACRVLHATLAVLGERLVEDEAQALAHVLPNELGMLVTTSDYDSDFTAEELFDRVARREHASEGRAREEVEIVLAVLGGCLSVERRQRIARGLPGVAAQLLDGECEAGEPPPYAASSRPSNVATVASSRPGSTHPLSEASPPASHTLATGRPPR